MSDFTPIPRAEWEQRYESQRGFPQPSMRPGEYRKAVLTRTSLIVKLLLVIAAGTTTTAIVQVLAWNETKDTLAELRGDGDSANESAVTTDELAAAEEYDTYDECVAASETTFDACEAVHG